RRRHTRLQGDWSSDVCSSDLRSAAGGVLVTKLNERSSKIVISAGITMPAWLAVRSLYSFRNAIMLMPCWPSAGPTGGAGVALPEIGRASCRERVQLLVGAAAL